MTVGAVLPETPGQHVNREQDDLVTVLVPALNEERAIRDCLESVLAQDYRNLQILVVEGGSRDATPEIVRSLAEHDRRVELLTLAVQSIPASLNAGLAAARGVWLVRVDAHSTVPTEYVGLAVSRLREGRWGGVGGRKDGIGRTAAGRAIAAAMASRFGVGNSTYHHGTSESEVDHIPFGAYPVELARRIGGWDERLSANEDFEFDYRLRKAGERLLFDPRLAITWESRQSIRALFRQYHRYGRGKADVAALHPASLRPRHLIPPAFVAYAVAAGLVAASRPRVAAMMLMPYAAALSAASAATARGLAGPRERAALPMAFLAMHVGWGTGFLSHAGAAVRLRAGRRGRVEA